MSIQGKTIIVTGASSGIGEATAMKLASEGANVILSARRKDRLEKLKSKIDEQGKGKAIVVEADVTKRRLEKDRGVCKERFPFG